MKRKKQIRPGDKISLNQTTAKAIADYAVQLAGAGAKALVAAEQLRIKTKPVERLSLNESERAVLGLLPTITPNVKKKLVQQDAQFTVAEVASMTMAVAELLSDADPRQLMALLIVANNLLECLAGNIIGPEEPARTNKASSLFQFKIILQEIKPPIWRRIQVPDCTLADLHEIIQAAMGWENYHMHQFRINGKRYGMPDPDGLEFGPKIIDETKVLLSQLVPQTKKFRYEYDFGDGWLHEIVFESNSPKEKSQKYPLCLDGSRACPPEDVGGPWGYAEFLEAIADPKHERHAELLEWAGEFEPDAFNAAEATKAMMKTATSVFERKQP
jgi:Plasmid pRiA4b ORF-3-like protein